MRLVPTLIVPAALLLGCAGEASVAPAPEVAAKPEAPAPSTGKKALDKWTAEEQARKDTDPLRNQEDLPPERRAIVFVDGEERVVDAEEMQKAGYTLIDLRDSWLPNIFAPRKNVEGVPLSNAYARVYNGLANDKLDEDGRALPASERNYLEVFGIPPSLSVLRKRTLEDADAECHKEIDYSLIASLDRMTYRSDRSERRHKGKVKRLKRKLAKLAKKKGLKKEQWAELADEHPKDVAYVQKAELDWAVLAEVDKRLECDRHDHKRYRHKKGRLDKGLRLGIRRFQRKHMLYEHTNLRGETLKTFATPPAQTNHASLVRTLKERTVDAAGVIEDGSTSKRKPQKYTGKDGKEYEVRNMVEEVVQATLKQTGLGTPEGALAFFRRHPAEDFEWLRLAVKMPEFPEYYAEHMELEVVVNRGDVWYDLPFNDEGKKLRQRRARMPKFSVFTNYNDQRIRLLHWPTTIGGWRTEQAKDGYIYYRYKGSDVGKRVIRKVIAGPTWVPPESTPLKSLSKRKYINGRGQPIVNYSEMGPGYLSAYGLVAGYFVSVGKNGKDYDRGIRAHGSSDYMSIRSSQRFSHGCHRLMNHHAVRLYGFLLSHRNHRVEGDQRINHSRQFLRGEQVYHVRLLSRGFLYVLDPPLPVNVQKGRIMGERRKPYEDFVRAPDQEYPEGLEMPSNKKGGDRAGGGGAGDDA